MVTAPINVLCIKGGFKAERSQAFDYSCLHPGQSSDLSESYQLTPCRDIFTLSVCKEVVALSAAFRRRQAQTSGH